MINKKRIRNVVPYLSSIEENQVFRVVYEDLDEDRMASAGFVKPFTFGQRVLPTITKSVTRFNAQGSYKIHRDKPKQVVYRQQELIDWHGNPHIVDVPYQRYPRTPVPPPSVEIEILNRNNTLLVVSPELTNTAKNYVEIKHVINLFLELFGSCVFYTETLLPVVNLNITRLNWDVLPQGQYPWAKLKEHIKSKTGSLSEGMQHVVNRRLEFISSFNHDFVAQGRAGFHGYMIFGFSKKNVFILESYLHGNATYVLDDNWEEISKLTKKEILDDNLHKHRFIHGKSWFDDISNLLS